MRSPLIRNVLSVLATGKVLSHKETLLARASVEQVRGVLFRILDAASQTNQPKSGLTTS